MSSSFPPVVRAIIVNTEWQILMTRHTKWNGEWVLPGGHVESDESLDTALIRELDEELGLVISFFPVETDEVLHSRGKALDMIPLPLASYRLSYTSASGKDKSRTEYIFLVEAKSTVGKIQKDEIADCQWMEVDDLVEGKVKTFDTYVEILERVFYEE